MRLCIRPCKIEIEPFHLKEGFAPFSLMSWPFLYCLIFNVIFCVMTAWSIQKMIRDKIYPSQSYDETLFWCLLVWFALQSFLGPITFWWDAPRTVSYFKKWKDFEDSWRCGAMYSVKRLRFTMIFSASIIPVAIIIIVYETLTLPKISIFVFLPYIPILVADVLMLVHWWLTLYELTLYSEQLLISLFKVTDRREIGYRRRIWLKITHLVSETGNALGASGLSYTSTFFVGFILSIYGILINLAMPGSSNVSVWGLLFPAGYSCISKYLAADAAYRATEQIGPSFTKKLLQINLSTLQRNCLNEIDLLVNCLSAKSPVIEYLGFLKITRQTFLQFVSSAVTYLIVFVQMKNHPKELDPYPRQEGDNNLTSYDNLS
nr:gustatory and odorant receptor 63a-like [Halyomorpha halys]